MTKAVLPARGAPATDAPSRAALIAFEGFVEVRRSGESKRERIASAPFYLETGDEVRTYRKGKATLEFHDGSQIILGPESIFVIEEESRIRIGLRLDLGRLWAVVARAKNRAFEVRTPVAIAAVRGTEFSIEALGAKQAAIEVFGGVVAVKGTLGDEALLTSRQRIDVMDGKLGQPERFEPRPSDLGVIRHARQAQGQKVEADEDAAKDKQSKTQRESGLKRELEQEIGFQIGRDAVESAAALEMKSAIYQEGKSLIDAFGERVRLEQYMLRPTPDSFKYVTLNLRAARLDFGIFEVVANKPLPDDLASAGDLWFSFGSTPPAYFAVKQRMVFSNTQDSVAQISVDGQSVQSTFQQSDVPICGANGCTFGTGQVAFFQTVFGNQYEFINGNPTVLNNIWTGATCPSGTCAARPADDPAMMWHTQPINVVVKPSAGGAAVASYWQDAFLTNAAGPGALGKSFLEDFSLPDPNVAHFIDRRDYLKFQDNGLNLGFLNFGDSADQSGLAYGVAGMVFLHNNQRLDGLTTVALPAARQPVTSTTIFADNLGNNIPGGANPTVVASSDQDQLILTLIGKSNTWQQGENFLIDDLGRVANLNELFARGGSNSDTASAFEKLNFERVITSSRFPGRKIDVVMDPMLLIQSSDLNPSSNGTAGP